MRRVRFAPTLLALVLGACGASSHASETTVARAPDVTAETFHEVSRAHARMALDDPRRVLYRDALVEHLAESSGTVLARGNYDATVAHLARLTSLLTPEDLSEGRIPPVLAPLARWVVEHGSPRGDEGRVMGALVLLAALSGADERAELEAERERAAAWGREARSRIPSPIERYGGLIQVWEQHEEIAPTPAALDTLARLYVEQHDLLSRGPSSEDDARVSFSFHEMRLLPLLVQRAPLDVAAVFLRHGQLETALERVRSIEQPVTDELVRLLRDARDGGREGAEALLHLSGGFESARPQISAAICRRGLRDHPTDARFPLCLARIAMRERSPAEATGWYAEAVRIAPEEREVYDDALGRLQEMIEAGLFDANITDTRAVGRYALEILDERERRWPDEAPAVRREELLIRIGRAEMNAGDVEAAERHLVASLEARETREGNLHLGELLRRTGRAREAARRLRRALDMTGANSPEDRARRAELLELLGDAFRQGGDERQALRMYRQALELVEATLGLLRGEDRAIFLIRRGVLKNRLGDPAAARATFQEAMEAAPSRREAYAAILAHLMVVAPEPELAQEVFRRAQFQISLEPQWKVYFALWVQSIAGRASTEASEDVGSLLGDLADGDAWSARLAAFGSGTLPYEGLLEAATTDGERTEAHFYEGVRLLSAGETRTARARLEAVLASGMVDFYEYAMARELLERLSRPRDP